MHKIISQIMLVFYLLNLAAASIPAYTSIDLGGISIERICKNKEADHKDKAIGLPGLEEVVYFVQMDTPPGEPVVPTIKYCHSKTPAQAQSSFVWIPRPPHHINTFWNSFPIESVDQFKETLPPLIKA